MTRRGKIDEATDFKAGITLRDVRADDRAIIEKDRMLVDIAYGSGCIVISTDDKVARVSVRLDDETVWLTNLQLSQLFKVSKATVSEHIKNIFESGELMPDSVVRKFRTTAADGKTYDMSFYNLDMIISLGYGA